MKRQTVIHVRQKLNTSERRTCNVLGVARSTMTYQSKGRDEEALRHDKIRLAKMYGRYGYSKIVSSPQIMYRFLIEFLGLAVSCLGLGEGGCDCTALAIY